MDAGFCSLGSRKSTNHTVWSSVFCSNKIIVIRILPTVPTPSPKKTKRLTYYYDDGFRSNNLPVTRGSGRETHYEGERKLTLYANTVRVNKVQGVIFIGHFKAHLLNEPRYKLSLSVEHVKRGLSLRAVKRLSTN